MGSAERRAVGVSEELTGIPTKEETLHTGYKNHLRPFPSSLPFLLLLTLFTSTHLLALGTSYLSDTKPQR